MAKVFADDVVINYTGTQLYLLFTKSTVYDARGNNNGRLDPGESVSLTATLKNIGGASFTNLSSTLSSTDPYITVTDNSGYFGSIGIDATKENNGDPYVVAASASTPQGHSAAFRLITTQGAWADTFFFNLCVGTYQYLVWNADLTPTPGNVVDSLLIALGYAGIKTTTLPPTDLGMYQAIFVLLGIYPNNLVISASSAEATALVNYLNSGGRMYMEGGDCWYYDPLVGGYNFCPLFGIYASADGSTDLGPIAGQSGTFTNTMDFGYAGENSFMDHIDPTGTGFLIFLDTDNLYNCGVANDVGIYRTVGTSFELGALTDGSGVSTRKALVDSIMHFFGINLIGVEETPKLEAERIHLQVSPTLTKTNIKITFGTGHRAERMGLKIFDATGRLVKDLVPTVYSLLPTSVTWDRTDEIGKKVPAGIYFVHLIAGNDRQVEKIILVE